MTAFLNSSGQQITGEYAIKGNHEMVAVFKFDPDSSFQFYFVYGAIDRMAKGSYSFKDGKLSLHSHKVPGRDFSIKEQKIEGRGTTIKVTDNNPALQKDVMCLFIKGKIQDTVYSDEEGIAHSQVDECDSVFAMHTLYPDVLSTIKDGKEAKNNYYEVTLNPSLAEVSFQNFVLKLEGDTLTGSLPYLFETEKSVFEKR